MSADGTLVFSTPPSSDVPELMRGLGAWLGSDAQRHHAVVTAALAHLELVAIHPFHGGNGRTARALSQIILARQDLLFDGLVSLDAQLDLDRPHYFAAIRAAIGTEYEAASAPDPSARAPRPCPTPGRAHVEHPVAASTLAGTHLGGPASQT